MYVNVSSIIYCVFMHEENVFKRTESVGILPLFVEQLSAGSSSITQSSQELLCACSLFNSTAGTHVYTYAVAERGDRMDFFFIRGRLKAPGRHKQIFKKCRLIILVFLLLINHNPPPLPSP